MRSLRITAPRSAETVTTPRPVPGQGEVRVRVAWVGLCGSDLSTWRGINPLVAYPRIPGHEVSGTVEAVGPGVADVDIGDEVLVVPYTACGRCSACRAGRGNCCRDNQTLGVQRDGAMSGALVVPAAKLMRVPGLDLRALAVVEPLSVGFHAAARGRVSTGETVVVIGCGAVGIGAVAGAAARGARVVAVDVDPRKLDLARRLGAGSAIDASAGGEDGLATALAQLDGGDGPAVVIEAAGQADAVRAAISAVAFAGRIVCIGYTRVPVSCETKRIVQKELDMLGSRNAQRDDFTAAAAWLVADPRRVDLLVTRSVGFADAAAALSDWDRDPGAVGKILVDCATAIG
jgi:threonine dehydrogenase-like Zn-dependent dehydrogenase